MDFDNARRDELMEEDALGEWERYVQAHQSSTSATSSDKSHTTPLTFEQWFRRRHEDVRTGREPSEYYHSEVDTSDSGYRVEREWVRDV